MEGLLRVEGLPRQKYVGGKAKVHIPTSGRQRKDRGQELNLPGIELEQN